MTRGWALFWGLLLVLVGGLALLFNAGLLQPEQLSRLTALWPLLLIIVGLQIVLARVLPRPAAAIALSVIAFVLVAGSVGYVVSAPPLQQTRRAFTIPGGGSGAATVHVDLGAASIEVGAGSAPGAVANGTLDYTSGFGAAPDINWDEGSRTLDISHSVNGGPFLSGSSPDRLSLSLDSATAWTLQFDTGASSATLNLGGATLKRVTLSGGADTVDLTLGAPSGLVPIEVQGGANRVSITRPAASALHVDISGGASSFSVDGHDQGTVIGSISWSSPNYPAADAFEVGVNGGANRVTITTSG